MPTTPTYPGVYVEEIPSGVRTITGVATSIAAFVDYFERGPMNRAVQLFNMGDFEREFGGLNSQSEASYAIQQFFLNGGTEAWVVRVASEDPTEAQVEIDDTIPAAAAELAITAVSAGEWGNRLRVRVDNTLRADNSVEPGRFDLIVSDYAAVNGRNTLVVQEVHRNLSMDDHDKNFVETVVNDSNTGSKLVRVKANGTSTHPANPPLINGTLSGLHDQDPEIPISPMVKVAIGHNPAAGDPVTVPLRFSQDAGLSSAVPLETIAPVLQSALRRSLPAEPAFAGATVEVVGNPATGPKRLRVLAGSDDPNNRVTFENIPPSLIADDLKLTADDPNVSNRKATLSGQHDTAGPKITASSPVQVTVDGNAANAVPAALDFSDVPGPFPRSVSLDNVTARLQTAIHQAEEGVAVFEEVEVYAVEDAADKLDKLLVLAAQDASHHTEFGNTAGTTTADDLKLVVESGNPDSATNRMATLSGVLGAELQIAQDTMELQVSVDDDPANADTVTLDFSDPLAPLPRSVSLTQIAQKLEPEISGAKVYVVDVDSGGSRLVVLSAGDASHHIEFVDTGAATPERDLKLVVESGNPDSATNRMATLSGAHEDDPVITAAPPIDISFDGTSATMALVFQDTDAVALPNNVSLEIIASKLQEAMGLDTNFAGVGVHVLDNRLLVLSRNDSEAVEFGNTPGTNTADILKLTTTVGADRATNVMATLSGAHEDDPEMPEEPAIVVTLADNTFTVTPDFSGLGVSSGKELLAEIASRLQTAVYTNKAFRDVTVYVVVDENDANRLLVLSSSESESVTFATTEENTTAADLLLTTDMTGNPATTNVKEYTLGGAAINDTAQVGGEEGSNGVPPNGEDLTGDEEDKTGIYALEDVDLFNLLCIPRVAELPVSEASDVIGKAYSYCEKRRAFFLIDTPKDIDGPRKIKDWVASHIPPNHNAAFFYPRVRIADPLDDYRLRSVGASGTLAGLFARTDSTRGVWKAPAGTAATLANVQQLDAVLTDQENGALNKVAINCLRNFPIYGNVCWGTRTLEGSDQQGSEWKYIPVRRLTLFLEESLYRGTKWVVFEPNDEPLWSQIRLNLGAFMHNLFRQGAFAGTSPRDAYFVKCDAETTTPSDIDLGIVNILVGFRPRKPAEFVFLKIQQMIGQIET